MHKWKIYRGIIALITILILVVYYSYPCCATQIKQFDINSGEVVFLLDSSISMNKENRDKLAIDAVRQAVCSLPSNYKKGLVIYNTGIKTMIPFGEDMEKWDQALDEVTCSGYTNAGEAMQQAIGMFSDSESINRYVVMLTDGEIDMPSRDEKEFSRLQYERAVKAARDKGIKIFIIAIGAEWGGTEIHIFDGAEATDGAIYWEGQSGSPSKIVNRILYERFQFPCRVLDNVEQSGGTIYAELPAPGAECVRILLLSGQEMPKLSVDCDAGESMIKTGQNFAVIEILKPVGQSVVINSETEDALDMEVYMVVEYKAEIETQITYRREPEDSAGQPETGVEPSKYKHFADIEISLAGRQGNPWNNAYYEGREISFTVDGVSTVGNIHNGSIWYSVQVEDLQKIELELDFSGFSERFEIQQPVTITFSLPEYPQPELPQTESKLDYRPLLVILVTLTLSLTVLLVLAVMKNGKTKIYMMQSETVGGIVKKEEIKGCVFTGKLNIYVLQTPGGDDIPPLAYRLFGRQAMRIPLSKILDSCNIKLGKIGEENIIFCAGPDKALIAMDQSENCTMLRGTEILKKGVGYPVHYNGKLTVIFEDGITEVEIHYKNIKPSEQANI